MSSIYFISKQFLTLPIVSHLSTYLVNMILTQGPLLKTKNYNTNIIILGR